MALTINVMASRTKAAYIKAPSRTKDWDTNQVEPFSSTKSTSLTISRERPAAWFNAVRAVLIEPLAVAQAERENWRGGCARSARCRVRALLPSSMSQDHAEDRGQRHHGHDAHGAGQQAHEMVEQRPRRTQRFLQLRQIDFHRGGRNMDRTHQRTPFTVAR